MVMTSEEFNRAINMQNKLSRDLEAEISELQEQVVFLKDRIAKMVVAQVEQALAGRKNIMELAK